MRRAAALASLIVAGESVFVPPFYLGRFFKSSMMETLSINELDLGQLGAIYGAVAMVCYAVGGPIADRFSPRTLIASSLIVTGCGSLYLATFPSLTGLRCLYAFWGASTILLFWAPLVRATREWGGEQSQGRAFGLLDGGRGLYAALVATVAAYAFGAMMAGEGASEADAVRKILYGFALCCAAAALAVWVCVPSSKPKRIEKEEAQPEGGAVRSVARDLLTVLSMRSIWLTVMVVFSAYCAFKMFDFYGLYLEDSAGYTKSQSARTVAYLSYLRVASALAAGWIADKWLGPARTTTACFALLIASYVLLISAPGDNAPVALAMVKRRAVQAGHDLHVGAPDGKVIATIDQIVRID